MSASISVQKAVVNALADLNGLAGVYDGAPVDAAAPYAVIGPHVVAEWGTKTEIGHEHRLLLTFWDDQPGSVRMKRLMSEAEMRLSALGGGWDGHRIVNARLVRSEVGDSNAGWRQGRIEMRIKSHRTL
jgi:hypothetical protein